MELGLGQISAISAGLNSAIDGIGRIFGAKYASKERIEEGKQNSETQRLVIEQRAKTVRFIIFSALGVFASFLTYLVFRNRYSS